MPKSSSNRSSSSASRSTCRAKPLMAKAGYTANRRRYDNGGKANTK